MTASSARWRKRSARRTTSICSTITCRWRTFRISRGFPLRIAGVAFEQLRSRPDIRGTKAAADLLQLIRHLGDSGFTAGFFLWSSVRRATEADAADRLFADFDRNATLEWNDLRELSLAGSLSLGALHPLEGCPPESPGRVGFAAGEFEIMRCSPVALYKSPQPPGTIDDGHRHARAAFGDCRFHNRQE